MDQHGEIILYQTEDGITIIVVRFESETVWLTHQQMAELFQSSRTRFVGMCFSMGVFVDKYIYI